MEEYCMMEKAYLKRKFSIAAILFGSLLLLISATTVHAASNPLAKMPLKDSTVINKGIWWTGATFITPDLSSDVKISVTSSNPKVATVEGNGEKYTNPFGSRCYAWYKVIPVSPGTTKIKATVTYNKKTYTKTCMYTVYKWENPFKSLKVGSTNYQPRFQKSGVYEVNRSTISGKFTYKLNPGFVVTDISVQYYIDPDRSFLTESEKIKNGQKLPENTTIIHITAKSKKNNQEYTMRLNVPIEYR